MQSMVVQVGNKENKLRENLQDFLSNEDLEIEFPIEQLGEMQVAKDKLECKIEEDELIQDDDFELD